MEPLVAFNLLEWIDVQRRPAVCNAQVFDEDDLIGMIIGGPKACNDYHVNEGPEFFYPVEGNKVLKTIDDGCPRDIRIREGEMLMLAARPVRR